MGPKEQVKLMMKPVRRIAAIVYLSMIVVVLVVAIAVRVSLSLYRLTGLKRRGIRKTYALTVWVDNSRM